ncbi:MAG: phosphotransferase [Nitrospinaceae bacterium]|nr:phosphotransferase [Nitrospinaceae bacterium]NIR53594.1 phosphotransferase [Nitrospinaceae bacterium]NIS83997.1 phosphotransferase [Nitrospinaceae bacterium]NIT84606.1 phosphotransferase [Nitrospinaceae bacterium]NIU43110.1 phosphotransferase [Nitrospinaceae bacterium]
MPKNTTIQETSGGPRFDASYLADLASRAFHQAVDPVAFSVLQGDASTRRYYRLSLTRGANSPAPETLILMQLEQPAPHGEIDFIRILKYLQKLRLPVPDLYFFDEQRGLLLLEDCGDTTLEAHLQSANPDQLKTWYSKAVRLLASLQSRATRHIDAACPAYHLRFDVEKLMWEMDFMLEHFIEGLLGNSLSGATRAELRWQLTGLSETLAGQPVWFTHRDYHSRNLMVYKDDLVLLDFQDARMGPSQYDLVSLLRDSYRPLPDALVWELVDEFIQYRQEDESQDIDRDEFIRIFDLMSVQRNLKAIGTFAYQKCIMNNGRYLESIPATLNYVRRTLDRRPELKPLQTVLTEIVPEIAG